MVNYPVGPMSTEKDLLAVHNHHEFQNEGEDQTHHPYLLSILIGHLFLQDNPPDLFYDQWYISHNHHEVHLINYQPQA